MATLLQSRSMACAGPARKNLKPAAPPSSTSSFTGFGRQVFKIRAGDQVVTCVYYPAADECHNGGLGSRGVIVTAGGNNGDERSIMANDQNHMSLENYERFVRGQGLSAITFGEAGPDFLYSKLGNEVPQRYGIAVLSVIFRRSGQEGGVQQQTHDLMAALSWINKAAADNPPPVVLMGWSMGGASVVQSAVKWARQQSPLSIQHVLTIAGQPVLDDKGTTSGAAHLPPGCGITICHGTGDTCMKCDDCTDLLQRDAAQGHARNAGIRVKKFPGEHHGIPSMYNWLMRGRLPAEMMQAEGGRPLVEDMFRLTQTELLSSQPQSLSKELPSSQPQPASYPTSELPSSKPHQFYQQDVRLDGQGSFPQMMFMPALLTPSEANGVHKIIMFRSTQVQLQTQGLQVRFAGA